MSAGQPLSSLGHGKKEIICSLRAKQGRAGKRAAAHTDLRGIGRAQYSFLSGWRVLYGELIQKERTCKRKWIWSDSHRLFLQQSLARRTPIPHGHQLALPLGAKGKNPLPQAWLHWAWSWCGSQVLLWRSGLQDLSLTPGSRTPGIFCLAAVGERGKKPFSCGASNKALRWTSCWVLRMRAVFPARKRSVFYPPSLAKHSDFEGCFCLWQPKHKAGQKPSFPK